MGTRSCSPPISAGVRCRAGVLPIRRQIGAKRADALEAHAAERDVRDLRLETNRSLEEAINLYRSAGYQEVAPFNDEPYAHHWFEKRPR